MFFKPKFHETDPASPVRFTPETVLELPDAVTAGFLKKLYSETFCGDSAGTGTLCTKLIFERGLPDDSENGEEEYVLEIGEISRIYANSARGFVYGMVTLASMKGRTFAGILRDRPVCSVRGYRVYLPGRGNIPVFKAMVDFLAEYKYNSVILEIGGAMEYKRHTEINEKWVEFCSEMYADPHRAAQIEFYTYPWTKNSIHCENGDGGVLTQDECRDLAAYCRSRGLEVIPEVPTLSHSDYICLAHPEIAEIAEDAYPDTYCPNHPDTYRYVFDILDEVIEVFEPRQIHIGHDEAYTFGICERCRGTDPVDLYVGDIRKIKEYLDTKHIRVSLWAEKLLRAYTKEGEPIGGTGTVELQDGNPWPIPALWECRDKLPEGLMYSHWYWSFGKHHDLVYHDRGYPMFFGNFTAVDFEDWTERIGWGALGGWVSNWGSFEEEYMQRNIQYFNLIGAADAFWNSDFDSSDKPSILERTFAEAYRRKWENTPHTITVRHRTFENIRHEFFWCGVFIDDRKYRIGNYEVRYADGTTVLLPVKYGTNIGAKTIHGYPLDNELFQLAGTALPLGENGDLRYECRYENPYPDVEIESIRYIPLLEEFTVEYEIVYE
ncbi:MAG: family 20 glycosylhydrolase [Clostridia bacterium]|nr:family 20 glycosylhydrolase [Clostridia bacterium]